MSDVVERLEMLDGRLEQIERHTEHLVPEIDHDDKYLR